MGAKGGRARKGAPWNKLARMASAVNHFAGLDFIGPDASAFLQGYLTADLDALEAHRGLPMALCNIKGRAVASGWAFGKPSHVRLIVHSSVVPDISGELGKYLLFAKSKLAAATGGLRFTQEPSAGVREGPAPRMKEPSAGVREGPAPRMKEPSAGEREGPAPRKQEPSAGVRAGLAPRNEPLAPDAVALPETGYWLHTSADADEGHDDFANACVEAGFVVVSKPVAQTFLPQMIGLTDVGAVSFSKGCYLGQEVVARAQHRGEVKRKLRRYRFDGRAPVTGDDVVQDGAKVGTVTAVGAGVALACTRSDSSAATASGVALVSAD